MSAATVMDNPLRAGMRLERTAEPCTVIIFGASGDLTKRKLMPALYRLVQERLRARRVRRRRRGAQRDEPTMSFARR